MTTILKWIAAALLAVLAGLIASITVEYFRPYKKIKIHLR